MKNNILVVVSGSAQYVYINGFKLAQVRSVELLTEYGQLPTVKMEVAVDKYKSEHVPGNECPDAIAAQHFDAARVSSDKIDRNHEWREIPCKANFGGAPAPSPSAFKSRDDQNRYMRAGYDVFGNAPMSIREFQTNLPWSIKYSEDFRRNPQPHKDFAHALTHVHKAAGKLSAFVDDMDHNKDAALAYGVKADYGRYIADLVICAMRMANTFPGGVIDLQDAVKDRIESKNGVTL